MQGPIRCVLLAGLLQGCDPGSANTPEPDAPLGPTGLTVAWSSTPSGWPSTTDIVTLERARFAVSSLRVLGDAGPGDPRTTSTRLDVRWERDVAPGEIEFNDA